MKRYLAALILLAIGVAAAYTKAPKSPDTQAEKIARGKYLVHQVSLCGDCHTPHDERGMPIEDRLLQGAPIPFKPTVPIPNWADYAPPIVGLPGLTEEQGITVFMTGKLPGGGTGNPPMPQFRFNRPDAEAIVAYLMSLKKK